MSCTPIVEPIYPATYQSAAQVEAGTGQAVPNEGAGDCRAAVGVIRVQQGIPATVRLPAYAQDGSARFVVRDGKTAPPVVSIDASSLAGFATFDIPGIRRPGMYAAALTSYGTGGVAVGSTPYWVEVAATGERRVCNDPLTISEVRLEVRDQCGAQNELFDRLMYTDEQVAWAIRKPVDEFNATWQPATRYTVATFPGEWRAPWAAAAAGYLMRMSSIAGDRDGLKYSAGGVTAMESDISFVRSLSAELLAGWREWMRSKKLELNLEEGWGSLGSDYGGGGW